MKCFWGAWRKSQARGAAFVLLAAFLVCLGLILGMRPGTPEVWLAQEQAAELCGGWTLDGRPLERLPAAPADGGTAAELSRVFTESEGQGNAILLRTAQQSVEVWLDGRLLYEYSGQTGAALDVGPGSARHIVRLPASWPGATLTLRFTAGEQQGVGTISPVYLGTKAALLTLVFRQALPGLAACFLVAAGGLGLLAASFLFREGVAVARLRWLGALAVVTGVWGALETRAFQLFSGNTTLCYALVFTSFALVPLCVLGFLLTYPDFGRSPYFHALYWVGAANFVWIQAAQIFGWATYLRTITGVHLLLVLGAVGVVVLWVKNGRGSKTTLEPHLFAACMLFAGFGMVDMLRFYLGDQTQDDLLFTRWGFLCFVAALGWQVLQQASAERTAYVERRTLRRLAYTDALTGIENRTAFEYQMEQYRQGLRQGRPWLLVADLNGLKIINDQFGHAAGDEAIVHCAAALKEAFEESGRVYRIGGDEFCVLCPQEAGLAADTFAARAAAFEARMAARDSAVPYLLQAACGWCRPERGEGVDQAFSRADRSMYEKKAAMEREARACAAPGAQQPL